MASPTPRDLTVERLSEPDALWTPSPAFGWRVESTTDRQTAYELEVRDAATDALVAATGKLSSSVSHAVVIPGVTLHLPRPLHMARPDLDR
ncbi:hypothetical protein [Streptomyces hokutonensis]|uniref:glycoside hydrolase family 78 protein n=1 Tax=Streptomyces hokutonensis TaxID=1306990 RepID=UPI0036877319